MIIPSMLMNRYYGSGTLLGLGDTEVNNTQQNNTSVLMELRF